ncbi:hypothetical protein DY000_02010329 [Brassica cretica]|uniref:Uncharacterized protein n=1 Tax=Brassica cretica TaxID=69181 RepID=A0ABQ7CAY9_BRACR|nr:hypothetical protein DY000_02010329 [Brassica cretica]
MSNDKSRVISFDFRDECIPAKDTALTTNDQGTLGGDIECSGSKSVKPADKRSCSSLLSCFLVIKIYSFVQSTVALTLLTQSSRNLPLPSSSVHLQALLSDASTKTLNQSLFSSDLGFGTGFSHDLNLQFVNAKLCYHLVYEGLSLNQCSIHPCKLHSKLDSLFCWLSFKTLNQSSVHLQALLSDALTKTLNQSLFSSDLGFGTGFSHDLNLQFVNAKLCYHLVYEGLSLNQCSIHPCKLHSKLDSLFCWLSFKVFFIFTSSYSLNHTLWTFGLRG